MLFTMSAGQIVVSKEVKFDPQISTVAYDCQSPNTIKIVDKEKMTEKLKEEIRVAKQKRIDQEIEWDFERERIQQEIQAQDQQRKEEDDEDPMEMIGAHEAQNSVNNLIDSRTA